VFPVAWTILYILMGVSDYLIETSNYNTGKKNRALITYYISLFFNFFWSFIFFTFRQYLFAFIWLLVLLALVVTYTVKYFKINKTAGLLNIPYIFWLVFAGILNFSVYLLN
jgi:tryptophan-rich sensory protein